MNQPHQIRSESKSVTFVTSHYEAYGSLNVPLFESYAMSFILQALTIELQHICLLKPIVKHMAIVCLQN